MPHDVLTIGYEGSSAEKVLRTLQETGVEVLVDVRWRPASRKPGLSKTTLGASCDRLGIGYLHVKELGTPPEIMRHFRATGRYDWQAYNEFLGSQHDPLSRVKTLAAAKRVCLLCYEADAAVCHRRFVASAIAEQLGTQVRNLQPI